MGYYLDESSSNSSREKVMTFDEGIENALHRISFPPGARKIMTRDAQIIQNSIIKCISSYDKDFRNAFRGLHLAGSFLDDIRINLPNEFDLNLELDLPLDLEAVYVENFPGFVFIRVVGGNFGHRCVRRHDKEYYVDRLELQQWLRESISVALTRLVDVKVSRRRSYSLEYISRGTGVAHTIKATKKSQSECIIDFDFVPTFRFSADKWPRGLKKVPNQNLDWFAVPRKYHKANCPNDSRSFIISAPYWERLALEKKANLKNSLRLMKAFRNANQMGRLVSYMLKSLYLNECNKKRGSKISWIKSPGILLIRES